MARTKHRDLGRKALTGDTPETQFVTVASRGHGDQVQVMGPPAGVRLAEPAHLRGPIGGIQVAKRCHQADTPARAEVIVPDAL